MERNRRIFVAGHEAMTSAAVLRRLEAAGYTNLISPDSARLDLTDQKMVFDFFMTERPNYVFLASAKVGGILANSRFPAEFIYTNIQSQSNVIHAAWKSGVRKLLFLASSCVYPKDCPQPMKEEYLLSGKLEPTSEPYAVAKIAGVRMCQSYREQYGVNFISAVPADLYGPMDDFNPETGHVLASLLAKMYQAKTSDQTEVMVWGTGSPRRECLHVDDLADACLFLMDNYDDPGVINIGSGQDVSIRELAGLIKEIVGFEGDIIFDKSKPDGAPRKLLDANKISKLGWSLRISLENGIRQTYEWYVSLMHRKEKLY
ncbi:MAG: GDP-L-fucose synthase [Dehalococcoidales bacterium]|jgi:GDP-L-fucose synthase|nr:GDP-L-fucose synthase [Dehalococcoidales bacterium]MDP6737967.1 GDP-L-fucose synthase [Dehalococcoidales bacterium]